MIEQLEFLIAHTNGIICGCGACMRYLAVRELLMQIWEEPQAEDHQKKIKQIAARA